MTDIDLNALLKGVELGEFDGTKVPMPSFADWSVVSTKPLISDNERLESLVIRSGRVRLDANVFKGYIGVEWESQLSQALNPEIVDDVYDQFIPLVALDLPTKMRLAWTTPDITVKHFRQSTALELGFRGGETMAHNLRDEKSTARFALDFLARRDQISRMRIMASAGSEYVVDVGYGQGEFGRNQLGILIPVSEKGLGCWTDSLAEWMLRYNVHRSDLGSLRHPATRLAEVLQGKTREALQRKSAGQ